MLLLWLMPERRPPNRAPVSRVGLLENLCLIACLGATDIRGGTCASSSEALSPIVVEENQAVSFCIA